VDGYATPVGKKRIGCGNAGIDKIVPLAVRAAILVREPGITAVIRRIDKNAIPPAPVLAQCRKQNETIA
jgi:hypothetical protein